MGPMGRMLATCLDGRARSGGALRADPTRRMTRGEHGSVVPKRGGPAWARLRRPPPRYEPTLIGDRAQRTPETRRERGFVEETPTKKGPHWLRDELRKVVADSERRVAHLFGESSAHPPAAHPWVNGWFVRVGPDGVPRFTRVGDRPAATLALPRRPYWTARCDTKDHMFEVRVLLPGARRDRIEVESTSRSVRVRAAGVGIQYDLQIPAPAQIDPNTCHARFAGGLLTARLSLVGTPRPRSHGHIHYGAADSGT